LIQNFRDTCVVCYNKLPVTTLLTGNYPALITLSRRVRLVVWTVEALLFRMKAQGTG